MAPLLNIEFTKTYATQKNAVMAVEKLLGENQSYADTPPVHSSPCGRRFT